MWDNQQNTINAAELNFRLSNVKHAIGSGDDFISWARSNLFKAIDHHAENLIDPDTIVQIPELSMTLEIEKELSFSEDNSEVQAIIWDQVYESLKKAIQQHNTLKIPVTAYQTKVVMEYLRNGHLEEYITPESWSNLIVALFTSLKDNKRLREDLLKTISSRSAFERFYELTQLNGLSVFLKFMLPETNVLKHLTGTLEVLGKNKNLFIPLSKVDFYYKVFQLMEQDENSLDKILPILIKDAVRDGNTTFNDAAIPRELEPFFLKAVAITTAVEEGVKELPDKKISTEADPGPSDEIVYVGQAGLVLLAPFLGTFLKNNGHIGKKGQLIKKRKVPILLHYLATGETIVPEWKLSLPKILTGMRLGEHCKTSIKPTKKLDEKIETLLMAVIGHWDALRNTSADGLRETFLIREGRLKAKNGFYYLYIDEQTVDILLNYISWNYTTIKLNWMNQILFVEWNKS